MVNMNGTGAFSAYNVYSNQSVQRYSEGIREGKIERNNAAADTQSATVVKLSDGARNVLERIKEKYGNMDVFVANYNDDNEAEDIMSRGTKEFSLLITPDELEKMAKDEKYANERIESIDGAINMGLKISEQYSIESALGKDGNSTVVTKFGVVVGSDGKISLYANLTELTEKQKERINEKIAAEKEDKASKNLSNRNDIENSKKKSVSVSASSLDELIKKINEVDWSKIKEKTLEEGPKLDFQV